jgi:uncharacterized damage-inducible protein DinB
MSEATFRAPTEDEYAFFYRGYVEAARDGDLPVLLREQPARLRAAVRPLSEEDGLRRYEPGKWSVKEVLGHVADAERIFAYRLLRVARGDETPLAGFDQDAYIRNGSFDLRPLASLLADFDTARAATLALVDGLEPAALDRRGTANGAVVSALALVHILTGHAQHHLRVLGERYGVGG